MSNYKSYTNHQESRPIQFPVPCKIRHSIYILKMYVLPHGQQARSFTLAVCSLILQWSRNNL